MAAADYGGYLKGKPWLGECALTRGVNYVKARLRRVITHAHTHTGLRRRSHREQQSQTKLHTRKQRYDGKTSERRVIVH